MMTKPENYLLAIDGDCSAGAMGEHAHVIQIEEHNYELVENFLRAQNEKTIASHFYDVDSPYAYDKLKEYWAVCEKLKLIGFFEHKWHSRTEWQLIYEDDLSNFDKPYKIKQKKEDKRFKTKESTMLWLSELFGERIETEFKTLHKYKVVDNWLFFSSDDFWRREKETTVSMLWTDQIVSEIFTGWKDKNFDWSMDNLRKQVAKADEKNYSEFFTYLNRR